jgi:hypothetical protein
MGNQEVIPWNEKSTHSPKNSFPRNLSARYFLTFTRPDNIYRAAQDQFGVESSDIRGLPLLAREWTSHSPYFDGQRVVQWKESQYGILEHDFVARRAPA